jgi:hypothetical protein
VKYNLFEDQTERKKRCHEKNISGFGGSHIFGDIMRQG